MDIKILAGVGEGSTELSAFHNALKKIGIEKLNLIYLSSVIPEKSRIIIQKKIPSGDIKMGHRGYVVISKSIQIKKGKEAWAGLGWIEKKEKGGFFMEHSGSSKHSVNEQINKSFSSIKNHEYKTSKIMQKIVGIKCIKNPVCSVVCALYKTEGWGKR